MAITSFLKHLKSYWHSLNDAKQINWQQRFNTKSIDYLQKHSIELDPQQQRILTDLGKLYQHIHTHHSTKSTYQGFYLWGGVGTGKTTLMDLFYSFADVPKVRLHHHELFKKLMHDLHQYKHSSYPLEASIQAFTKQYQLACFDDLHLNDIADAKLWQGVFEQAQKNGLMMLITSNTHPQNLLDTPGFREKIQPLLDSMQHRLKVIQLDNGIDYRTQQTVHKISQHSAYLPTKQLNTLYYHLMQQPYKHTHTQSIRIQNRTMYCHSHHHKTIVFTLKQLCATKRSYTDYIELCERFNCLVIIAFEDKIFTNPLSLQRFIWLIDILYDKHNRCFMIADNHPINYLHTQQHPDLARTLSRLKQML